MKTLLDDDETRAAMVEPPEDTRAYFRGRCLAQYASEVVAASWDSVIFDVGRESLVRVPMMEPERGTQQARRRAVRPLPEREGPARGHHRRLSPIPRPGASAAPYAKHRVGSPFRRTGEVGFGQATRRRQQMATRDTGGQSQSGKARRDEEVEDVTTEANPEVAERHDEITEDVDDLLDEIDSVLEENAEEFVRGYVQKGGE